LAPFGKWLSLLLLLPAAGMAQWSERFLAPSDSLNGPRRKAVLLSEAAVGAGTLLALNQTWYADYPRSGFHFINDNAEWLQMDKAGHFFSAYHLGRFAGEALAWSGSSRNEQLVYGAAAGLAFLTVVEAFDGYSAQWGASPGDLVANTAGTALLVSQELLWREQRIIPKFSFHTTPYAGARPNVLGSSLPEQVLKDYNWQTYWLSANLRAFTKSPAMPAWLNIAIGYGAEGMVTGEDKLVNTIFFPEKERTRQFYLSVDADLTRIRTRSHLLKTLFSIFNTVKIPAPALEIRPSGRVYWHAVYF
jgi:hypothetical protein